MTVAKRNPAETTVAVLMGGWSAEREVSLASGEACAAALKRAGFRVVPVDVTRERNRQIEAKALRKLRHPSRSDHMRSFLDE